MRIRVAALVLRDARILLARHIRPRQTNYLLPGGGVKEGETLQLALRREMHEEAGVVCGVESLRYVIEVRNPHGRRHLLQFVFAASVDGPIGASSDARVAECAWHPIAELRKLRLHPEVGAPLAADLEQGSDGLRYLEARWVD